MNFKSDFQIVDTTLRDGEQSAGVIFSMEEKIQMAFAMDKAGIKWIEAGIPAMGRKEQEMLKALLAKDLKATLIAWNRAEINDIRASIDCGFSFIHISLPVSDLHIDYKLKKSREWVLNRLKTTLEYAKSFGCTVFVGAEDASRADPEFFLKFTETAAKVGAERVRYADTIGCLDPFTTYEKINNLVNRCAIPIEFHGHNDFGMATANTLAAFTAGIGYTSVTLAGIGERAGNAPLEEVATSLEKIYSFNTEINLNDLSSLSDLVSSASGRSLFSYKPIVGALNRNLNFNNC
ncbi:MAG: homocitrate synthase [Clostridiaceae bacterium]